MQVLQVRWFGLGLGLVLMLFTACGANPAERNNAGNSALLAGDVNAALDAYQVAQVVNPDAPVAYYNAAIALREANNIERAQDALEQALTTADDDLIQLAYFNLGFVQFELEDYALAVASFREVLERDPENSDARYNMELALMFVRTPTPVNQQQQSRPEEGAIDPETTPTDQPGDLDGPTPTPPRQDNPDDLTATPEGGSGDFRDTSESTLVPQRDGRMTVEEARRILDAVQNSQQALSEYLQEVIESGEPLENDW